MAHQTRGWVIYIASTSGINSCNIKADQTTATNNGATLTSTPTNMSFWPLHRNDMRAVYGVDTTGNYNDSCIALDPNGTLFSIGKNFSDNQGNQYTVNGLRTERYRTRNLK